LSGLDGRVVLGGVALGLWAVCKFVLVLCVGFGHEV